MPISRHSRWAGALLGALVLPALVHAGETDPLEDAVRKVTEVYALLEREAADPITADKALYEGAMPGMLRRLDPHSVFFDPGQFDQLKQMEQSIQKGFGTVVSVLPGRVIVLQTLPNTPSAKVGISAGDEIVAVNRIPLAGLETEQLVDLLGQARQRAVLLDVRRPGNARLFQFTMNPESVESPSVDRAFLLKPGVGYVRVVSFDEKTGPQVREAIEFIGGAKLQGLVLDLRNNPGGILPAALETASLFLKPGQRLLSIRGRSAKTQDIDVPAAAKPYEFPVAVLVNERSASASEIVAGAVQDHDRGSVLGQPSYGKGLVQSVFPLRSGTGMALTTAFYYTPSGRSIQRPLSGSQLDAVTGRTRPEARQEYKTDKGRVVRGGGGIAPDFVVSANPVTPLQEAIEFSASFTNFATNYTSAHKPVTDRFEVTPALLDEFRGFLAARQIQPGVSDWSRDREWIQSRLQQEILNQSLGVEKGDEVEMRRDPVVRRALEQLH